MGAATPRSRADRAAVVKETAGHRLPRTVTEPVKRIILDLCYFNGHLITDHDWMYCKCCGSREQRNYRIVHAKDCIVVRARAIASEMGWQIDEGPQ